MTISVWTMRRSARRAALAALAALGAGGAAAQQAGNWVLGAGLMNFSTRDSSGPLIFTSPVTAVVPGSGTTVGNANTLGLSANYFVTSNWVVEGVFGIPPRFDIDGTGSLAPLGKLGEAKQWSPSVVGKYYFNDAEAKWRPYLGLGVSYVRYASVRLTPALQGALAARLALPAGVATTTDAKLDSSFTPVFNAGIAWQFDRHWGVSLSVSYLPLKTTAVLTTRTASGVALATSQASVKVHPVVTYLAATYRF